MLSMNLNDLNNILLIQKEYDEIKEKYPYCASIISKYLEGIRLAGSCQSSKSMHDIMEK